MRLRIGVLVLAVSASGVALASPAVVPTYDIGKTCRAQAEHAYAATLGQVDLQRDIEACAARQRDQEGSVEALWPLASDADRIECLNIAEGRYDYLARCLDGSRSVRAAR